MREAAVMVRVSGAAVAPHRLAPERDVDADAVLSEQGYPAVAIAEMRARGSIW